MHFTKEKDPEDSWRWGELDLKDWAMDADYSDVFFSRPNCRCVPNFAALLDLFHGIDWSQGPKVCQDTNVFFLIL